MNIIRSAILAAALLPLCGFSSAFALSIDTTTATNSDGSAKFSDPDDKIPFPHVSDDGAALQASPGNHPGLSFGLSPSNAPDAFERAQENQQQ